MAIGEAPFKTGDLVQPWVQLQAAARRMRTNRGGGGSISALEYLPGARHTRTPMGCRDAHSCRAQIAVMVRGAPSHLEFVCVDAAFQRGGVA